MADEPERDPGEKPEDASPAPEDTSVGAPPTTPLPEGEEVAFSLEWKSMTVMPTETEDSIDILDAAGGLPGPNSQVAGADSFSGAGGSSDGEGSSPGDGSHEDPASDG